MTAQSAEHLHYDGETVGLRTDPLASYFAAGGAGPGFVRSSTACLRGYIGSWEIADGRLYLVALEGTLAGGAQASLKSVFPSVDGRVFAAWYSGVLRIPQGDLLRYAHAGYGSVYERDLFLTVKKGIVVRERVQHNQKASGAKRPDPGPGRSAPDQSAERFGRSALRAALAAEVRERTGSRGRIGAILKRFGLLR